MEREGVLTLGQVDENSLGEAGGGVVVLHNLAPEAPDLDPDTGVRLRIKIPRTAEEFRGDPVLLQMIAGRVERVVGQVLEQSAQSLGTLEEWTGYHSVDKLPAFRLRGRRGPAPRM